MRGIAQFLQAIERRRLRRILRGVIVDDDDAPARSADPDHLAQYCGGVEKMMEREPRGDDREAGVVVRQRIDVALPPGDVRQTLLGRELARPVEHGRSDVDPGRFPHIWRKGADDEAGAAGHVEQTVVAGGPGGLDDHPQRLLVGDRRGGAEDRRLARELVEDQLLVVRVVHGALTPVPPRISGEKLDLPIENRRFIGQNPFTARRTCEETLRPRIRVGFCPDQGADSA